MTASTSRHSTMTSPHRAAPSFHRLIVLLCHAVYRGGDPSLDESWCLLDYQRNNGHPGCFVEHIRKAVGLLKQDPEALLVISGGFTRPDLRISESSSHFLLAQELGLLDADVRQRMVLEEAARDSYENLLFGVCKFYEAAGTLPHFVTVLGFKFKEARVELHARALGIKREQFLYEGVNDPPDLASATASESKALASFRADPHGLGGELQAKRLERSPFGHHQRQSYTAICRSSPRLAKLLAMNSGNRHPVRTFANYFYRRDRVNWKVRDAFASNQLQSRLLEMGFRRDCDIVEQPAEKQFEEPFERVPAGAWTGSPADWCYLANLDLLTLTGRPPMDEDGRRKVGRSHTWIEKSILNVSRRFFAHCSRKTVTLAPQFAEQLPASVRDRAEIVYQEYDLRGEGGKGRTSFMAEYKTLRSSNAPRAQAPTGTCHRTCTYLAYSGAKNEVGCPVLIAFGMSGSDTYRLASTIAETHLADVFEEVVLHTGPRDRLVLVEFWRARPERPCDFEVILDATV